MGHLGPDLLGPDWDADEALRRLRQEPDRPIGLALLDQRNLAGIGNIYREPCFIARVHPSTPVGRVPDLPGLRVLKSKQLLEVNKDCGSGGSTIGVARPGRIVLGLRPGPPSVPTLRYPDCPRPPRQSPDADQRDVYFCPPHCQPQAS